MRRILVPRYPGVGSALGLLASDVRYDLSRTWVRPTGVVRRADLDRRLRGLEREARELLAGAGFRDGRALVEFQADMRYRGQAYELTVPLKPGELAAAERAFYAAHIQAYGHGSPVAETELVTLRARATGRVHPSRRRGSLDGTATGQRRPQARTTGGVRYRVYERDALPSSVRGPAIVEQEDSTVVVSPGWQLRHGPAGTVVLEQ
jgi:N-methylhydantoinase A